MFPLEITKYILLLTESLVDSYNFAKTSKAHYEYFKQLVKDSMRKLPVKLVKEKPITIEIYKLDDKKEGKMEFNSPRFKNITFFRDNVLNGPVKEWSSSSGWKQCYYRLGRLNGFYKRWDVKGYLIELSKYENGKVLFKYNFIPGDLPQELETLELFFKKNDLTKVIKEKSNEDILKELFEQQSSSYREKEDTMLL